MGDNIFNPEFAYIGDDVSEIGPDNLPSYGDSVLGIKSTVENYFELNNNLHYEMGKTMIRGQEKKRTHQLSDQQQNKELKDDYSFDEIQELSKFFESNDDYNTNQIVPVAREPLESLNHIQNISTGHNDARPASHDRLDREIA